MRLSGKRIADGIRNRHQRTQDAPSNERVGSDTYKANKTKHTTQYNTGMKALDDSGSAFQKGYAGREKSIADKYANIRMSLDAGKQASGQDMERALARNVAAGGGAGGGANAKLLTKGHTEMGKQFGSLEAGVSAEEAGAQEQLAGAKSQERFAREEALRAGRQFGETMNFQEGSFADQMRYSYDELDENKKTNLINAAGFLKDAGLDNATKRGNVYQALEGVYGSDRAPQDWKSRFYT